MSNFVNSKPSGLEVLLRIIGSWNYKEVDIIQLLTSMGVDVRIYLPEKRKNNFQG